MDRDRLGLTGETGLHILAHLLQGAQVLDQQDPTLGLAFTDPRVLGRV